MNKTSVTFGCGFGLAFVSSLFGQSMSVDSLDGPVTANEINSFVSYIGSISPVVWPNTGSMENQYAQGDSGEQIKAMGLMYEISGNTAILNRMIFFCDTLLSQRNDLLASPNGQRTYWNGKISPAWPGQALGTTPVYSTSASGDCVGHLANCARLILETPGIWSTTVPDGNPFGYGVTYKQRAQTYLTQADYTFSQCFFPDMLTLTNSGLTNIYCYPAGYPYQPGNQYPWNQAMMMSYPLQNLAIAHSILGDNPSLVAQYDTLVKTNITRFFNDSGFLLHKLVTDGAGNPAYDWSYTPTANGGEDSNHGSLDVAGFYRAYDTGRYGVTASQMTPFANMVVDIMTGTVGSYYHGTVEGTDGTGHAASTTYLRSGYFFSAEFRPDQYYNLVSGLHITAPGTTTSIDAFSRLMWIKNLRYGGASAAQFSIPASAVTASGYHTGYPPANAVDNNLATRWACSGDGCWIQFDLGAVKTADFVEIAWYDGTSRIYTFDVEISADGTNWTPLLTGQTSSGTTNALEKYSFAATSGRYLRVVGHQNNVDSYTNITEFQAWGTAASGGTTFTINASAGANGSISPSGSVVVNQGASQGFTVTPANGYVVAGVTVDGSGVGAVSSYTFSNVQANHTISATFSASTGDTNLAPTGTGYGWNANTSATANTNRTAQPGLNDNNLSADVDLDANGDAVNAWEAAGVIWSSAKTLSSADFINGTVTSGGDGFLTASCSLQFTTNGTTWTASGWTLSPAYPYSSSASGKTYTFTGTPASGILGARVVGQVRTTDTSYHWIVKEVQFIGH